MDLHLFNNQKNLIATIESDNVFTYKQVQKLNGLITASVEAIYTEEVEQAFYFGSQDVDNPEIYWMYKIDTFDKTDGTFTLKGTYILFDDLKSKKIIEDKRPTNNYSYQALTTLLDGTGWQIGNEESSRLASTSWYYINSLQAFWDLLDVWKVEFRPEIVYKEGKVYAKYIYLYDRLSDDHGAWYEYGDQLLTVKAETDLQEIYTAFYGRGKGERVGDGYGRRLTFENVEWSRANGDPLNKPKGQGWIEFKDASLKFGYEDGSPRFAEPIIFNDIEDENELIQATYETGLEYIRPKVQFSASVLETEPRELGETCTIIRYDLGIRYKTRIFEYTRDFKNPKNKEVEFGDELVVNTTQYVQSMIDSSVSKTEEEIVDGYVRFSANNYNRVFTGETEPTESLKVGDTWYQPIGENDTVMYQWNGTIWDPIVSTKELNQVQQRVETVEQEAQTAQETADKAVSQIDTAVSHVESQITQTQNMIDLRVINDATGKTTAISLADGSILFPVVDNKVHITNDYFYGGRKFIVDHIEATYAEMDNLRVNNTIDASKVRVINLDALSITANKTSFVKSVWNSLSSVVEIQSTGLKMKTSQGWDAYLGASGLEFRAGATPISTLRASLGADGRPEGAVLVAEPGYHSGLGYRRHDDELRFMIDVDNSRTTSTSTDPRLKIHTDTIHTDYNSFMVHFANGGRYFYAAPGSLDGMDGMYVGVNLPYAKGHAGSTFYSITGGTYALAADKNSYKRLN